VREQRPLLYRAADMIDPSGGARELADSLYADLYGLEDRGGKRQSLFHYFHGRSSLATWLRAVLAQRYIDRLRAQRRVQSLPDEDSPAALASPSAPADPDRPRYVGLIAQALGRAVSRLDARDRLRLGCYYAQEMTLAQIGRLLREHEATASRHLARTRRRLRADVEHELSTQAGLTDVQIAECFESVMGDAGPIDLSETLGLKEMLGSGGLRKGSGRDRSK
jgi:RNA polymerase sigma factor (sigma-70 family)